MRIYAIGLILCLVAFGQASFFYWGVLQSLAVSSFLVGTLYLLPARKMVLLSTVILTMVGYYYFLPYTAQLPNAMATILLGDFSLLLVIGFLALGLLLGTYILPGNLKLRAIAAVGLLTMTCGLVFNFSGLYITRYPASLSYIFFVLGMTLLLYTVFIVLKPYMSSFTPFIYTGKHALNIFVLHYLFYLFFKHSGIICTLNGVYASISAIIITAFFVLFSKWMSKPLKSYQAVKTCFKYDTRQF